jgi:EAL domain-containing protein (putative c-di-GMP-specific phosphodiesterase class I)
MPNVRTNSAYFATLRERGVSISIDDFGTDWSNLSQLTNVAFDELKIDRIFLVNSMSQALGIRLVFEGSETQEQ